MAGTYELLRLAERIEALSAALYGFLAERFRGDAEARALFLRLESEELQHASRIRLLAARYRHDAKILQRVAAEPGFLERLVRRAEEVVGEVRAGAWGDDVGEVKRRLAEVELVFCHAHSQFLSEDGHPELRAFFAQLAEQDEAHAELLRGGARPHRRGRQPATGHAANDQASGGPAGVTSGASPPRRPRSRRREPQ